MAMFWYSKIQIQKKLKKYHFFFFQTLDFRNIAHFEGIIAHCASTDQKSESLVVAGLTFIPSGRTELFNRVLWSSTNKKQYTLN